MKQLLLLALLAFGFTGCTVYQIDSRDTSSDFYAPKKNIDDVAYLEKIDKPFVEIGIVTVTTERRQSLADILPKLKQEAAILGADAIMDVQSDSSGVWKSVKLQEIFGNGYIRSNISAKAVVYK